MSHSVSLLQPMPAVQPHERDALADRYGEAAPASALLNATIRAQLAHRSVRAFDDARPLPTGALEAIVAAAQSAATSSHLQQWSVVAIQDPERKRALAAHCGAQAAIERAPLFLAWFCDLSRLERAARAAGGEPLVLDSFEALIEGVIDTSLAAQNAVVALESLGLGAVFIGSLRNRPEAIADILNLPPKLAPVFGLCVGYADPKAATSVKPRLPQTAVLHRETYDAGQSDAALSDFDRLSAARQTEQRREPVGWLGPALARITRLEKLGERAFLRQALQKVGFPLN